MRVKIKIDDHLNSQIHALLIFLTIPHQSCILLYKCRISEVPFSQGDVSMTDIPRHFCLQSVNSYT